MQNLCDGSESCAEALFPVSESSGGRGCLLHFVGGAEVGGHV